MSDDEKLRLAPAGASDAACAVCLHTRFVSGVAISRLTETDGGPVTGYSADIRIKCATCGARFRFLGTPAGYHPAHPMVNVDGTELRAPIAPE